MSNLPASDRLTWKGMMVTLQPSFPSQEEGDFLELLGPFLLSRNKSVRIQCITKNHFG